ncbi:MAG: endolytic transglycosylase MltG [Oscillospiraceae bacterium]|nr:endolytic transglycosylase MltG [Oscillospiraceae bacterium]
MSDRNDFWKELMGEDFDESQIEESGGADDAYFETDEPTIVRSSTGEAAFEEFDIETFKAPERESAARESTDAPKRAVYDDDSDKGPDNFKINFDFEREYESTREYRPIKRSRERRTGCLGGILYFAFVLAVSLALAAFLWIAATDVLAFGKENRKVEVTLDESMFRDEEIDVKNDEGEVTGTKTVRVTDVDYIAEVLYDQGLIKYKWLFTFYGKFSHAGTKVSPGTYELNGNYDYRALVSGMTKSWGTKASIDITIPEGFTMAQIFELMEKNGVCEIEELSEAAKNYDFDYDFLDKETIGNPQRLEGFLFPDTYTFYVGDEPTRAINKMLSNFENKWTSDYAERASNLGYSVNDIVNIASMIEREAAGDSERSTIASVIYNRLNSRDFLYLNIDATIYYAMSLTGEEFSTELESPYNTYYVQGLPAGPIANPGIASIKAALWPDSTNYYYYALSTSGMHEFFKTAAAHTEFVNSDAYGG